MQYKKYKSMYLWEKEGSTLCRKKAFQSLSLLSVSTVTIKKLHGRIKRVIAIKNNKSIDNDVDGLYAALTEFKSGNKTCEQSIEYGRSRFLTPVRLIGKSEHYEKSYKWKHVNIWHYPYYMRAKVATFRQIVIKDEKDYIRAIKPEFESLEYALDETFRHSDKVGVMFWGFPEMIRYNDATKTTSLRLYILEQRYADKLSACADLNMKNKIELQSFCDEIFGDG